MLVTLFNADSKGRIFGSYWKVIDGVLKEDTYRQIMKNRIQFSTKVPFKTDEQMNFCSHTVFA